MSHRILKVGRNYELLSSAQNMGIFLISNRWKKWKEMEGLDTTCSWGAVGREFWRVNLISFSTTEVDKGNHWCRQVAYSLCYSPM